MSCSRRALLVWAGGSSLHPVPARTSEDFRSANLANMGLLGLTHSVLLLNCTGGGMSDSPFTSFLLGLRGFSSALGPQGPGTFGGLGCWACLTQCRSWKAGGQCWAMSQPDDISLK